VAPDAATRNVNEPHPVWRCLVGLVTHARLYHLDEHSHIIDSPGLQEFGLAHVSEPDIAHAFVEFRPYLGHCRFSNCRHRVEPGCAVLEAAMAGKIDRRRLGTFHKLVR